MHINRYKLKNRARLGRFLFVSLLVAASVLVWADIGRAQILFQEDWETTSTKADGRINGWDGPADPNTMYITSSEAHSGNKSLELRYDPGSNSASFMNRVFPGQDLIYHRWYQKWSPGFIWSGVATKMVFISPSPGSKSPGFSPVVLWGNGQLAVVAVVVAEANWDNVNLYQNVGTPVVFKGGGWYCVEVMVRLNTPGKADAEIKAWIDGQLKISYANREFRGTSPNDPAPSDAKIRSSWISGYYNSSANGAVPQLQYSWHDDHVVSTQRIGCLPGVSDVTPPSPPSGLRATSP